MMFCQDTGPVQAGKIVVAPNVAVLAHNSQNDMFCDTGIWKITALGRYKEPTKSSEFFFWEQI